SLRLESGAIEAPTGVSLDHLAETVNQRLGQGVAAAQTVGGGPKHRDVDAGAHTQVELTQLSRYPRGRTRRKVRRGKPFEGERIRQESRPDKRKRAQIVAQPAAHAADGGADARPANVLDLESLECLHERRDLRLRARQSLAL